MKKIFLLAILFSLSATTYSSAQNKQTQKEMFQATYNSMKSLVQTQQYNFVGDMVYSNKGREQLNAAINTIVINKSEISGKIISLRSENKSFDVNGTIKNYNLLFNDDKQQISIQFKVKTKMNTLNFNIEIKPNGNAFLTVSSGTDNISWTGHIK